MTLPYRPLSDFILVLADDKLERTANGIILTEALQTGTKTGVVVAVGPGRYNEKLGRLDPLHVKIGQRVTFGEFAGRSDLPVDPEYPRGKHYKVISDREVLAVVEPNDDDHVGRIREAFRMLGLEQKMDKALAKLEGKAGFLVAEELSLLVEEHLLEVLRYNAPELSQAEAEGINRTLAG